MVSGICQQLYELVPVLIPRRGKTCAELFQSTGVRKKVLVLGDKHIGIVQRRLPQACESKAGANVHAPY